MPNLNIDVGICYILIGWNYFYFSI